MLEFVGGGEMRQHYFFEKASEHTCIVAKIKPHEEIEQNNYRSLVYVAEILNIKHLLC